MTGLESGLTDPEVAEHVPDFFFTPGDVDGRRVWARCRPPVARPSRDKPAAGVRVPGSAVHKQADAVSEAAHSA